MYDNEKIRLSIITVTRNDRCGLERTYLSLKSQRILPFEFSVVEWIVIDGASADDTHVLVSSIKFEGNFIFLSEPDVGIFDAMNKGVGLANGGHVLYLNAGDVLAGSDVLSVLINLIHTYPDKIIAGRVLMSWKKYTCISDLSPWVCHQSVMTPKIILDRYPFDINKKFFGDLHLWMRLKRDHLFKVVRIDKIICNFYLGGVGNNPENLWNRLKERHQLSKEFGGNIPYVYRFIHTLSLFVVWRFFGCTIYYRSIWLLGRLMSGRS